MFHHVSIYIKSAQFMSGIFSLFVWAFSDIMEEFELNFSFPESEFWTVFSFSVFSGGRERAYWERMG